MQKINNRSDNFVPVASFFFIHKKENWYLKIKIKQTY